MQLLRAWNWVDRVEQLHQADYSLNLSNCGILQLLLKDNQTSSRPSGENRPPSTSLTDLLALLLCSVAENRSAVPVMHPLLGCTVYVSYRRSVGRLLCGWAALHAVSNSTGAALPPEHPESQELKPVVEQFEAVGLCSSSPSSSPHPGRAL
jgi:hypothetical protein